MQSFFKRSKKSKEKEAEAEAEKANANRAATPPPTYEDAQGAPPAFDDAPPSFDSIHGGSSRRPYTDQEVANLSNAFSSLRLATQRDPDVSQCLAHLKLLYAIQTLKEEVGYTDGLWDLWDTRAGPLPDAEDGAGGSSGKQAESRVQDVLARIREKRWAVFLARAVDRYETWWKALSQYRLCEKDMEEVSEKYLSFPNGVDDYPWTVDNLPPLGKSRTNCSIIGVPSNELQMSS